MNIFDKMPFKPSKIPEGDPSKGHSIAYSKSMTSQMMGLGDANVRGNIHGGVIMRMVDESAAIVAMKHARHAVVTARVERFDFIAPAYMGNVVSIHCAMNYVGRTSMEVAVEVTAEDLITDEIRLVARSQVIYVALDDQGRPTPVPPLIPANEEEAAQIEIARIRRERIKHLTEEMEKIRQTWPLNEQPQAQ